MTFPLASVFKSDEASVDMVSPPVERRSPRIVEVAVPDVVSIAVISTPNANVDVPVPRSESIAGDEVAYASVVVPM